MMEYFSKNFWLVLLAVMLAISFTRLIYIERIISKFKKAALNEYRSRFYASIANANNEICKLLIEKLSLLNNHPELLCAAAIAENNIHKLWAHSPSFENDLVQVMKRLHYTVACKMIPEPIKEGLACLHTTT